VGEDIKEAQTEREKLAAATRVEKEARMRRVMEQIEKICEENNCQFIATPYFVEVETGGFVIAAKPGVKPL